MQRQGAELRKEAKGRRKPTIATISRKLAEERKQYDQPN
jgi:hypothetical protein